MAFHRHFKGDNNMNSKQQQTAIPQEQRQACEVWTRVMGYHRPVASFNTGKKSEYAERTFFKEAACSISAD
jgi:anaerobic ribonucleoside-triphosphate reductase